MFTFITTRLYRRGEPLIRDKGLGRVMLLQFGGTDPAENLRNTKDALPSLTVGHCSCHFPSHRRWSSREQNLKVKGIL